MKPSGDNSLFKAIGLSYKSYFSNDKLVSRATSRDCHGWAAVKHLSIFTKSKHKAKKINHLLSEGFQVFGRIIVFFPFDFYKATHRSKLCNYIVFLFNLVSNYVAVEINTLRGVGLDINRKVKGSHWNRLHRVYKVNREITHLLSC